MIICTPQSFMGLVISLELWLAVTYVTLAQKQLSNQTKEEGNVLSEPRRQKYCLCFPINLLISNTFFSNMRSMSKSDLSKTRKALMRIYISS